MLDEIKQAANSPVRADKNWIQSIELPKTLKQIMQI